MKISLLVNKYKYTFLAAPVLNSVIKFINIIYHKLEVVYKKMWSR